MEELNVHVDDLWPYVLTFLPEDMEEMARACEALVRCRGVPDASALLRMILAHGVTDLSLKDVAAWACASGTAQVSGPALFYRVRDAPEMALRGAGGCVEPERNSCQEAWAASAYC